MREWKFLDTGINKKGRTYNDKKQEKRMKDLILNFLLRVVFGAIAIVVCNTLLSTNFGIGLHLGLNLINLLTIGTLGISGFGLVAAVSAFSIL